jgi:hypothetical protein
VTQPDFDISCTECFDLVLREFVRHDDERRDGPGDDGTQQS